MTAPDTVTTAAAGRHVMAAIAKLERRARARLGEAVGPVPDPPLAAAGAAELLRRTADAALQTLREVGEADPWADELTDIITRAQDLERELRRHILAQRTRRRGELDRALLRLGSIHGSVQLLDRACEEAVRACGLRRVLLSRVRDGVWSPWKLHSDQGADGANAPEWLSTTAIALDDLPLERTVVATVRPERVGDAASDERMHHRLRRLMRFESFVVAPIAPADHVVGLLHADSPAERRVVDDDDRDLLWAFAEGFGRLYERALMLERFEASAPCSASPSWPQRPFCQGLSVRSISCGSCAATRPLHLAQISCKYGRGPRSPTRTSRAANATCSHSWSRAMPMR